MQGHCANGTNLLKRVRTVYKQYKYVEKDEDRVKMVQFVLKKVKTVLKWLKPVGKKGEYSVKMVHTC